MWKVTKAMFVGLSLLIMATSAHGKEEQPVSKDWEFNLAPMYLWAVNLSGDAVVKGKGGSIELDFNDIFDNLEAAYTARFEAMYKNKWIIFFDYNYLNIAGEQETPLSKKIKADVTSSFFNLTGGYRVLSGTHSIDAFAGIRYTFLEVEVTFLRDPVKPVDNENWVDPIFGLRYRWQMFDKWSVTLYGDAGGGANADLTWQGLGVVNFQPWKHVSFSLGYRGLYWDYKSGSGADQFEWDTTIHGPIIGVNFNW